MITRRTLLAAAATSPLLASGATKKKLPYLQIGVGHPHANKIGVYRASEDWEVIGVVEEDEKLREAAKKKKEYQDLPFLSLDEGLQSPGLKVVGIETEVRDLLRYARVAVDAGFHVHLDKPAGTSFSEYRELLQRADAKGLVVQMGYMYRFNPAIQLLHQILDEGWLGQVFETHAVISKVMPSASRQVIDEFDGGTMFELGCHIIDLTVGVLGAPEKVQSHPRRTLVDADDTLVDNMLAVLEYPTATATVRSTALEVEGFSRRHFTVCGTEGTCHIQPLDRPVMELSLSQARSFPGGREFKKGRQTISFDPPYARYVADAADLAATVRGEQENRYPSAHDLAVQETVLRASDMPVE